MPSTAVICCCSSVNGTGVAGTTGAGGVEGGTKAVRPLLTAVVPLSCGSASADDGGGGVWDWDKGDGPGKASPDGPGKLYELDPGRASPLVGCEGGWACGGWYGAANSL